eukprot:g55382.t1
MKMASEGRTVTALGSASLVNTYFAPDMSLPTMDELLAEIEQQEQQQQQQHNNTNGISSTDISLQYPCSSLFQYYYNNVVISQQCPPKRQLRFVAKTNKRLEVHLQRSIESYYNAECKGSNFHSLGLIANGIKGTPAIS